MHLNIVLSIWIISFVMYIFSALILCGLLQKSFLKVAPQKRNQEGLSQVIVEVTDPQTSVNPLKTSG